MSKYDEMFEDAKKCFGKLFDAKEAECKKCTDTKECQEYMKKGKAEPERKKVDAPAPEQTKQTKKSAKKAPPVKKEEKNKKPDAKSTKTKSEGKDAYGFKIDSKASVINALIVEGKHTKEDMLKVLDKKYPGANNKVTLGVFLSDVQKPVGTYSGSRGVKINTLESGVLVFLDKALLEKQRTKK